MCQLYQLETDGTGLRLLASAPEDVGAGPSRSSTSILLAALEGRGTSPAARALWPDLGAADLLLAPLAAGDDRIGLLCAGSTADFSDEDAEMARAIAHLSAVAIRRAELHRQPDQGQHRSGPVRGSGRRGGTFAAAKAADVRCDLNQPYLILYAEPGAGREQGSGEWRETAESLGPALAALTAATAVEAGPGPLRALLAVGRRGEKRVEELIRSCRGLAAEHRVAMGIGELRDTPAEATRAYREAVDAATIGRALLGQGGAIAYSELGAYRYLVHIAPEDAPHDRMRAAVDRLIEYDRRLGNAALLDTLERYLAERRSVIESARALYIHPNTLRQRLGRIEELTGLSLDQDDLLSLELAIKLARLHGRPGRAAAASGNQP